MINKIIICYKGNYSTLLNRLTDSADAGYSVETMPPVADQTGSSSLLVIIGKNLVIA